MTERGSALGLADMPPEILAHIGEAIGRPRDLLAAQIASSLFAGVSLVKLAARCGASRMRHLIEAGAPAAVVHAAIAHGRQASSIALIRSAVCHSSVRVLDVLFRAFQVRRRPDMGQSLCPLYFLTDSSPSSSSSS